MNVPIEVTTSYATSVDKLSEAWTFVMSKVDMVGPDPSISINPIWSINSNSIDDTYTRRFEVLVRGMVEEK